MLSYLRGGVLSKHKHTIPDGGTADPIVIVIHAADFGIGLELIQYLHILDPLRLAQVVIIDAVPHVRLLYYHLMLPL
jgi:hypothetical protein